jgi:hypothetical protein
MSRRSNVPLPEDARLIPRIILIVLLLPAPFRPGKPGISPSRTLEVEIPDCLNFAVNLRQILRLNYVHHEVAGVRPP